MRTHVHMVHGVHMGVHMRVHIEMLTMKVVRPGTSHLSVLIRPSVHISPRDRQPHLTVDMGRPCPMMSVVKTWEDDLTRGWVCMVGTMERGGRRNKHTVVGAWLFRQRHMIPSEKKVPGGVMMCSMMRHVAISLRSIRTLVRRSCAVCHGMRRTQLECPMREMRCMRCVRHERVDHGVR